MAGHDVELFCDLPALDSYGGALLANRGRPDHQRLQTLFESINRLDGALDEYCHSDHRPGDHQKRQGYDRRDDHQPEQWFVWIHLQQRKHTLYRVLYFGFVLTEL